MTCCTEALINGGSQKDLEGEGFVLATDTQHLYLSSTFFFCFLFCLGCENAGLVLMKCQIGHLVILYPTPLSLDVVLDGRHLCLPHPFLVHGLY